MNQDPELSSLLDEIEQMKLSEKRAGAAFWVHRIIKYYKIITDFIANMLDRFKAVKMETDEVVLNSDGFKCKNFHVVIKDNTTLQVEVDGRIAFEFSQVKNIGNVEMLEDVFNCFSKVSNNFRNDIIKQIAEYEKALMAELENF